MIEWISVKERPPKDNERVLAYRPNEDITCSMVLMWGWALRSAAKRGITHWMPLPEPPGDGKETRP